MILSKFHSPAQRSLSVKQNPKKSRFFKIFGGLSLATLITCGTVLSFTPFPTHANTNSNNKNLSAQEQLLNGTLELDSENDPVIYTTTSGIEIKFAMTPITPATSTTPDHAGQATSPSGLSGYAYLKMGNYNWIVIGYHPSNTCINLTYNGVINFELSDYLKSPNKYINNSFTEALVDFSTPASVAVQDDAIKQIIRLTMLNFVLDYSYASPNETELDPGEFLVLCQDTTGNSLFGNVLYESSTLLSEMRKLYYPSTNQNNAGFSISETNMIVAKTLITNGSSSLTEYLYPLALHSGETFSASRYLATENLGTEKDWWSRSRNLNGGNYYYYTYYFSTAGETKQAKAGEKSLGIRPAMVVSML